MIKGTTYTPEQLKYLSWLNNELAKKEKQLYERCKNLFKVYEKRVKADSRWASFRNKKNKAGDLDDYMIEMVVQYRTGPDTSTGSVRYVHTESVHYSTFEDEHKKDEIGFGHVKDTYPEFKTPEDLHGNNMCWFFWKFYDDLPVNLHFKISEIWFEINICEQNVLQIVKYEYM